MGQQRPYTSSGSKSRDTQGSEPSQEDVRKELKGVKESARPGQGAEADTRVKPGQTTQH